MSQSNISRRTAIAAFSLAAAGASLAIPASASDDRLAKLIDDFKAAEAEEGRLRKVFEREETLCFDARSEEEPPEALHERAEDADLDFPTLVVAADGVYVKRIDYLREPRWLHQDGENTEDGGSVYRTWKITPSAEARARADEIIQAYDEWQEKRLTRPPSYEAAEKAHQEASDFTDAIAKEISSTPARTLTDLIKKVELVDAAYELEQLESDGAVIVASVLRDLLALA